MMTGGINCTTFFLFCVVVFIPTSFAGDTTAAEPPGNMTLQVITTPAHAKIFINSEYAGISPLVINIPKPGNYYIEARLSNQTVSARITLSGQTLSEVNLAFPPQPFNILAFIILLLLTVVGIVSLRRIKPKEVIYSSNKKPPAKQVIFRRVPPGSAGEENKQP